MKRIIIFISVILWIINPFKINAQLTEQDKQWEDYFTSRINDLDPIEGLYIDNITVTYYFSNYSPKTKNEPQAVKAAIYKVKNWYSGNLVTFTNTANPNVYMVELENGQSPSNEQDRKIAEENYRNMRNRNIKFSMATLTNDGILEYSDKFDTDDGGAIAEKHQLVKLFPTANDYQKSQKSSGSGFCISSNGIIVTNNHVVEGARKITVKGVNSNFNRTYNARVLTTDKNNDLALIQIDDNEFRGLSDEIPFVIKTAPAKVGENVFVLGYPLPTAMGDEIKLTNGIISARTGYQGDVTTYQISAPIQPGNSGGPVFDSQGNLVGIINAKLTNAENASYAVKSIYLKDLIEMLPTPFQLPSNNLLVNKSLSSQVEMVKKFVYIIETE